MIRRCHCLVTPLLIALAGWWASHSIPPAPPTAPDLVINLNPASETIRTLGHLPPVAERPFQAAAVCRPLLP